MQPKTAKIIMRRLTAIAADPYAHHANVTRLQGSASFRLRVGDWRAIYRIAGDVLQVIAVRPRGSAYD